MKRKIHLSNAETVQLARELRASVLLADEEEVRRLASEFGLEVRGCLGLLVEAVRKGLISITEAKHDAERLVEEGYRVDERVLKEFYIMLESEESR
jgi:predicted nucleic acid-binding protein